MTETNEEFSRQAVRRAMQDAWNEICSDTGCHPLDIRHEGKKLFFEPAHWTDLTAKLLFVNAIRTRLAAAADPQWPYPSIPDELKLED